MHFTRLLLRDRIIVKKPVGPAEVKAHCVLLRNDGGDRVGGGVGMKTSRSGTKSQSIAHSHYCEIYAIQFGTFWYHITADVY